VPEVPEVPEVPLPDELLFLFGVFAFAFDLDLAFAFIFAFETLGLVLVPEVPEVPELASFVPPPLVPEKVLFGVFAFAFGRFAFGAM